VITDISDGRSILAVQGPSASRVLEQLLDARVAGLGRFGIAPMRTMGPEACIARTGYTGGDGFELFVPNHHAVKLWDAILAAARPLGARPIGLGARDTLRVEAGLRRYGSDMDTTTTPWEADLGWTVAMNKTGFIGRDALRAQKEHGVKRRFVGFELAQGPVPRPGFELSANGRKVGTVTSGTFSPVLGRPLGMGYVEPGFAAVGTVLTITVRGRQHEGTVVKLPFWRGERQPAVLSAASSTVEKLPS
jgi:aminomethyltransferase